MKQYIYSKFCGLMLILSIVVASSCQRDQVLGEDPYAGGKEPFGITFTSNRPEPATALPGEVVRIMVRGLKAYEDKFQFTLNDVPTEIVALSDSTIDIRVPYEVSSGNVAVILNGQYFSGPRIGVEGKLSVDMDYKIVNGFNSITSQIIPHQSGHIVVGMFTDFEDEAVKGTTFRTGIHYINSQGESDESMDFRRSATGSISSIAKLPNGQFIVGGYLTEFSRRPVGGIARLTAQGALDTMIVEVINPDAEKKPLNGLDTVSAFNGGLIGGVTNVFPASDNGVYVVGSFEMHYKIDYNYSSRENRRPVYTNVKNVAKLKADGSLDSSFNRANTGLNGIINGAVQLKDGRIVIVGAFTTYNGKRAENIVCIKPNGQVDESFTAAGGANRSILSVTYNPTNDKVVLAGNFVSYAAKPTNGLVILNSDGTMDSQFVFGDTDGEMASYAYKLNNGRVLVTGSFEKYNNIGRSGILLLEPNGTARQEYNNLGRFSGIPYTLVETTSSLGHPAVLLGGLILSVDGKSVGNIVKIEMKN